MVVTRCLLRAHCRGVPAFAPVVSAVAAVPGFSSASGDAQYLTPTASRSSAGYWPVQRVPLDLRTPNLMPLPLPLAWLSSHLAAGRVD